MVPYVLLALSLSMNPSLTSPFFRSETKGLSLEQVDILYRNSSIIKSNSFRKQILAENMHDEDKEAYQQNKSEAGKHEHVEKRDLGDGTV